jgi:hypothetical protein
MEVERGLFTAVTRGLDPRVHLQKKLDRRVIGVL